MDRGAWNDAESGLPSPYPINQSEAQSVAAHISSAEKLYIRLKTIGKETEELQEALLVFSLLRDRLDSVLSQVHVCGSQLQDTINEQMSLLGSVLWFQTGNVIVLEKTERYEAVDGQYKFTGTIVVYRVATSITNYQTAQVQVVR